MSRSVGAAAELDVAAAFQDAVEDGLGEIRVVEDPPPGGQGLVGREDQGAVVQMAVVDDLEEDVGGVGAVAEITDLIDDQHGRVRVPRQDVTQATPARDCRELIDEIGGGGEEGVEAILDGPVGKGDRQVRLAGAARAAEDERVPLRDEVGAEGAAEQRQAHGALEGEVVLVDGLQEGEPGAAGAALDPGLRAMGNFLGHQQGEVVAVRHAVALGAVGQVGIEPADGRQVQAAQEAVEVEGGRKRGAHWTPLAPSDGRARVTAPASADTRDHTPRGRAVRGIPR